MKRKEEKLSDYISRKNITCVDKLQKYANCSMNYEFDNW